MSKSLGTRGKLNWDRSGSSNNNTNSFIRPNFFVAVQICDQEVHNNIIFIQNDMVRKDRTMRGNIISSETLHITLMVMHLKDSTEYQIAKECLQKVHSQWNKMTANKQFFEIEFNGLGNFGNRVLFANIIKNQGYESLIQLQKLVINVFENSGILSTDNRPFNPHLTIAKVKSRPFSEDSYWTTNFIKPELYCRHRNDYIGASTIKGIQLLDMLGPKTSSGYYSGEEFSFS